MFSRLRLLSLTLFLIPIAPVIAATLSGTVRDSNGDPIQGANVWVNQNRDIKQAVTDAEGAFAIPDLLVTMTEVVVYKENFALGGSAAPMAGDEALDVVLRPADLISIRVIDTDSRPIAGVKVRSMLIEQRTLVSVEDLEPFGYPALRSTDNGTLVIPNLPPDGFVQLTLHHLDFADSSIRYLPVDDEQRNIIMERGGRASGRITFGGKAVTEARVSIFKVGPQGQKEFAEILSDKEGFFSARLKAGSYRVAALHPEYASPPPVALEVPHSGDADPVSVEMLTPRYVKGSVLFPDKSPCPGAWIQYRVENTIYAEATTDNNGTYQLRVPSGRGALNITAPQGFYAPLVGEIPEALAEAKEMTIEPILLEPLPVIVGDVVDTSGKAPGQILVTALNLPVPISINTDVPIPFSVLTDEAGHFSLPLDFMPASEELELRAEHPLRFQRADFTVKIRKPKPAEVTLEQFTPDLAIRNPIPGANNLSGLQGKAAPPLTGDAWMNCDPVTMSDLRGKVVVLLFWAGFDESIGPVMLRELHVIHELLKGVDDVAFLSVHDAISSAEEIKEYIKYFNVPYPVLRDSNEQTTFGAYGIVFIPQLVLIDKKGVLRYYQTEGRLLELIKGLRRE